MAEIKYTANRDIPENIPGVEKYSIEDTQLISSFELNTSFDTSKHFVELHLLSLSDELLFSEYDYRGYSQLGNAQSAGQEGASVLSIDPIKDSISFDYGIGGVKLLYHFLNDLYTDNNSSAELYIKEISPDRTELKLSSLTLSPEDILRFTGNIKNKLESEAFFNEFRLNFGDNDLFIGTNIDVLGTEVDRDIVVKLYEPLPFTYEIKSKLRVVELVSDSVAYEVDTTIKQEEVPLPTLKPANFNIEIQDESIIPTQYFNYDELFSYPVNNANSQLFSLVSEKGIEISIDHTNYSDFIHFSSAQERLINFKYKLDLVTSYSASLAAISTQTAGLQGISGSRAYYESLMEGVLSNFDHYERFLYYESGSSSWPKSNTSKPYINQASTTQESILWYSNQIAEAISYDNTNYNSLVFSIPSYLREDVNNENYLTFIYMIGQHFDNLWLYANAVTDKYDADNRLNKGISKDLVGEALKNFGVKLYTSNKSIEDLFSSFIGQGYVSGSRGINPFEKVNNYVTGSLIGSNTSIEPSSFDNYQKEIQKRIYHNLSYLLKTKGTERGLRALINCFGIPSDILDIKIYGGRNTNERPFYGDYQYYTSSLDKIRTDHTGSIISGSTLSQFTSIIKRDNKYTDDLHNIEVGFSPTDNVDRYIISKSLADPTLATFNIDDYIGNPSNLTLNNYEGLYAVAEDILGNLTQYDVRAFVRLIKFFDNVIFKMVKDFVPARTVADTGIIIKPNLLNRSKAKSVKATVDTIASASIDNAFNYTSSIDTVFTEGKHGNTFGAKSEYTASYIEPIGTPIGTLLSTRRRKGEAKFDGEFSNSRIRVTDGELNRNNTLKRGIPPKVQYNVKFFLNPPQAYCSLNPNSSSPFVVRPDVQYSLGEYLGYEGLPAPANTSYYLGVNNSGTPIPAQHTFSSTLYGPYAQVPIYANAGTIQGEVCEKSATFVVIACTLGNTTAVPASVIQGAGYNLLTWFQLNQNTNVSFEIKRNGVFVHNITAVDAANYTFNGTIGDEFTVTIFDTVDTACKTSTKVPFYTCLIFPEQQGQVVEKIQPSSGTVIIVDLTQEFSGQVAGAQYYYQIINPSIGNQQVPSPLHWVLEANPTQHVYPGNQPRWIKLVNVETTCERYIKLTKKVATLSLQLINLNINKSAPPAACGVPQGHQNYTTDQNNSYGLDFISTPVYYERYSDETFPNNLQGIWTANKRIFTLNQYGTFRTYLNNWVSDGITAAPYSNGFRNSTALTQYYQGTLTSATTVNCYQYLGGDPDQTP